MNKEKLFSLINKIVQNNTFVQRGFYYAKEDAVDIFDYYGTAGRWTIEAGVEGTEFYTQTIELIPDEAGGYNKASTECTCMAYEKYGTCKHIAAVLFICEWDHQLFSKRTVIAPSQQTQLDFDDHLLEQITPKTYHVKPEVQIYKRRFNEYQLKIDLTDGAELRIENVDITKLYTNFGSSTLSSNQGDIRINDLFLADTITDLEALLPRFKNHKLMQPMYNPMTNVYTLTEGEVATLLEHIKDLAIPVAYSNQGGKQSLKPIKIKAGTPDYHFTLSLPQTERLPQHLHKEVVVMTLHTDIKLQPIPVAFIAENDAIVIFDEDMRKCLETFLITKNGEYVKRHQFLVPFPYINQYMKTGNMFGMPIAADEALLSHIKKVPLKIEVQATKDVDGMRVEPFFVYDDIRVEAITRKAVSSDPSYYIDNDIEREFQFLELFSDMFMLPIIYLRNLQRNFCYVERLDDIMHFLEEQVPKLVHEGITVLLDRALQIMQQKQFNVSVRIGWLENNLLSYDLETEFLAYEELAQIMQQYKLKTRYIRLDNGAILDKHNDKVAKQLAALEGLDLAEFEEDETVEKEVPLYRALGIAAMQENKSIKTTIDKKTKTMLRELKNPTPQPLGLPEHLKTIMRPYQLIGVHWLQHLVHYQLGGILADDMGLGKTLQVIAYLSTCSWDKPVIIIAPKTLIYNWQNEFTKFAPTLKTVLIDGTPTTRAEALATVKPTDIIITSYPLIVKDYEHYPSFSYIFIDEAQYMKNPQTKLAKTLVKLDATYRFALSGTPFENNLMELWSIFNFIMPGFFTNKKDFKQTVITPIHTKKDDTVLKMLKHKIQYVVLRRLKKDVLQELPDKIETALYCELSKQQKEVYQYYFAQAQTEIREELANSGFSRNQIKILAILTRLRQVCTHPAMFIENYHGESAKMELLHDVLGEALSAGHKVLLFSQFTSMLELIEVALQKQGINYYYLHGQTKAKERMRLVEAFNTTDNDTNVFLLSLKAGGTGLNLTAADIVIHFDPWWNPSVENQATDRAHRFGQKNTVQVFQFIAKDTIEEKIQLIKQKKQEMFNTLFNDEQAAFKQFSESDIKVLLDLTE